MKLNSLINWGYTAILLLFCIGFFILVYQFN